jgi:hypothetical protein
MVRMGVTSAWGTASSHPITRNLTRNRRSALWPDPVYPIRMPDAVVTGATGNVGSWTVRFLREAGRPVRVAVRDPGRTNFGTGVERVRFDFGRPETYRSAFWGAKKTVPRPPAGHRGRKEALVR